MLIIKGCGINDHNFTLKLHLVWSYIIFVWFLLGDEVFYASIVVVVSYDENFYFPCIKNDIFIIFNFCNFWMLQLEISKFLKR